MSDGKYAAPLGGPAADAPSGARGSRHGGSRSGHDENARWEKAAALARQQLDLFITLEPKVLNGRKARPIHDIRVASRRLQALLDLLYAKPRPGKVRRARKALGAARRALGEARNCDVLLKMVEAKLARSSVAAQGVWLRLRRHLARKRQKELEKASRKLTGLKLAAVYRMLSRELQALPERLASEEVEETAPCRESLFEQRVLHQLRRRWSRLMDRIAQAGQKPPRGALHAVRIAARRVRYLVEVMKAMDYAGAGKAVSALRSLQQLLGEWHDLDVLEGELAAFSSQADLAHEDEQQLRAQVRRTMGGIRRQKRAREKAYLEMVRHSRQWKDLRRWVGALLARQQATADPTIKTRHAAARSG